MRFVKCIEMQCSVNDETFMETMNVGSSFLCAQGDEEIAKEEEF
jgi:hypothetical protein